MIILKEVVRSFLSIDIEDEFLRSRIVSIQKKIREKAAKIKLVKSDNLHLTWRFFGDISTSQVELIHLELQKLKFNPFEIQLGHVGAFPNIRKPRVIWVGVIQNNNLIMELKQKTDDLLSNLGYIIENRKFSAHVTIARVRSIRNHRLLSDNLTELAEELIGPMIVDNIRMTKSTLTKFGSIYETMWEISTQ